MMVPHRVTLLAFASVLALSFGVGCRAKKKAPVETTVAEEPAKKAAALSLLEKYPSEASAPGSKTYPLKTISTENLLARIKEGGPASSWPFALVDARQRVEFDADHITGALNCPAEKTEERLWQLVPDKDKEIVFYCNGATCTKSQKGARAAMAAGWSKVVVYEGGMPVWRAAGHPITADPLPKVEVVKMEPKALHAAHIAKQITIIDIRPRDEYLYFRVPGAIYIELDDIAEKLSSHVKPGPTPICIADYTGTQGELAVRYLTKLGYTNVKTLEGGLRAWQGANLPIEKGLDKAPTAKAEEAPAANPKAKK